MFAIILALLFKQDDFHSPYRLCTRAEETVRTANTNILQYIILEPGEVENALWDCFNTDTRSMWDCIEMRYDNSSTRCTLKGLYRSSNFRQFQHWSNGQRMNWNNKITTQIYRGTQTKHGKAKKEQGWARLARIELDCIWVNLKNVGPPFFKFISLHQNVI